MLCKQGHSVARIVHYADGSYLCPQCHEGFSEVGKPFKYMSIPHKQDIERQRETHAGDLMQPFEVRKGEKDWVPNKKFIKEYKDKPEALAAFSDKELKDSGVISEKVVKSRSKSKAFGSGKA